MNIRGFVAFACTICIISMFATLSTAVPLPAIDASFPRSLPNIEVHTFLPRDTELYPRVFRLFPASPEESLKRSSTFEKPDLSGWIKLLNAQFDKAKLDLTQTKNHFDEVRKYVTTHPINNVKAREQG
ncbi:hypothetical protein H0H93_002771, partial [Arthromyces matolae]